MWIHTTLGFYSVTQSPLQLGKFQIRARTRAHLEALVKHFDELASPGFLGDIIETPRADYRWRVVINRARMQTVMGALLQLVTYTNFKQAAHVYLPEDVPYHQALTRTWSAMAHLQNVEREQEALEVIRG